MSEYTIRRLMRPNIVSLTPYSSARNEFTGDARVFLDANENWRDFTGGRGLNRYPDPQHTLLKQKFESVLKLPGDKIVIGNGSDEIIDILFRVFCVPHKDKVLLMSPTYGAYEVFASIHGSGVSHCQLKDDFSLDLQRMDAICKLVNNGTPEAGMHKMLFICSPNNPSGNSFPIDQIEMVAQRFKGITVVDEAYIDFSDKPSAVTLLDRCPRLVVLRTLSKAWALANVRVGVAVAHPDIIDAMHKVKYPYNVSGVAQECAIDALDRVEQVRETVAAIRKEREAVAQKLEALPYVDEVFPSDANFLLLRVTDPDVLCERLRNQGIIIRNRSSIRGCFGCVRITIGSSEENAVLIEAMQKMEF